MLATASHTAPPDATPTPATHHIGWQRPADAPDAWWLRPVDEPEIESELICTGMTDRLLQRIEETEATAPALRLGLVYGANAFARLGRRDGDRVQVTASYIARGAGISRGTARVALRELRNILVAEEITIILGDREIRCDGGYYGYHQLIPEAIAACIRVIDIVGAPEPLVGAPATTGRTVEIEIPRGKTRGKTRCPCDAHARGDQRATLAFDLGIGRATCQYSGALYAMGADGQWTERRGPFEERAQRTRTATPSGPARRPGNLPYRPGWHPTRGMHEVVTLQRAAADPTQVQRKSSVPSFHGRDSFERAMVNAARRFCGPAEEEHARLCESLGVDYHLRGIRFERVVPDWDATQWAHDRYGNRLFPRKMAYKAVGTSLALIDLDGLAARDTAPDEDEVRAILRAVADTELQVVTITRTSRTGVQVVCRLPGFAPDVQALYRDLRVRRMLEDVGKRIRQAINRGGHVDPSAWAPGRLARRPGWRTAKDGSAVCARLAWTSVHGFLGKE